eukprot:5774805-Pleurochrysis_carterae.AAC.1
MAAPQRARRCGRELPRRWSRRRWPRASQSAPRGASCVTTRSRGEERASSTRSAYDSPISQLLLDGAPM